MSVFDAMRCNLREHSNNVADSGARKGLATLMNEKGTKES